MKQNTVSWCKKIYIWNALGREKVSLTSLCASSINLDTVWQLIYIDGCKEVRDNTDDVVKEKKTTVNFYIYIFIKMLSCIKKC